MCSNNPHFSCFPTTDKFACLSVSKGHKLKETLLPSLNLLTESARIHRETRKFLRSKVSYSDITEIISEHFSYCDSSYMFRCLCVGFVLGAATTT